MASGSLPPGFPATEIDGEYYWDGGCVSNTPLQWVLEARPSQDTLAFQVDLWSAVGEVPRDFMHAAVREKEIRFCQPHPGDDRSVQKCAEGSHSLSRTSQTASR